MHHSLIPAAAGAALLLAAGLLPPAGAAAATETPPALSRPSLFPVTTPTHREPPTYPETAARKGREAWVAMTFTITAEGRVADVRVVDSTDPTGRFNQAAVAAMQEWRYEPPMLDGTPTDRHNVVNMLTFRLGASGVTPAVSSALSAIQGHLEGGRLDEARTRLADLEKDARRIDEQLAVSYWWSVYHQAAGNLPGAVEMLGRAIDDTSMSPAMMAVALPRLLALQLQLGHMAAAATTLDRVKALPPDPPRLDPLIREAGRLLAEVAGGAPYELSGGLTRPCPELSGCPADRARWRHPLDRTVVEVAGVTGAVDTAELRCERGRQAVPLAPGDRWTVPDSQGTCTLEVVGAPGTRFTLIVR